MDRQTKHSKMRFIWEVCNILPRQQNTKMHELGKERTQLSRENKRKAIEFFFITSSSAGQGSQVKIIINKIKGGINSLSLCRLEKSRTWWKVLGDTLLKGSKKIRCSLDIVQPKNDRNPAICNRDEPWEHWVKQGSHRGTNIAWFHLWGM